MFTQFLLKQFRSKDNSKELFVIPSRYYHNVAEHDISEPLSEEDFVRTSMKTSKRQPSDYYWVPRNEPDRYENVTPLMRRARTKPDMDRLIDSEMNKARRCNRCGNLSNKKNEPPVKSTCRFDDSANIPIKGSIGEIPYLIAYFILRSIIDRSFSKKWYYTYYLFWNHRLCTFSTKNNNGNFAFNWTTILLEIEINVHAGKIYYEKIFLLSIFQVTRPRTRNNYTAVASMPRRKRTLWIFQLCTRWNHADPVTQSRRYTTFPSTGRRNSPPNIVDPRDTQENRMRSWRSRRDRCTRLTGPRVYLPDTSNKIVPSIDRNIYTKEEGYNNPRRLLAESPPEKRTIEKIIIGIGPYTCANEKNSNLFSRTILR